MEDGHVALLGCNRGGWLSQLRPPDPLGSTAPKMDGGMPVEAIPAHFNVLLHGSEQDPGKRREIDDQGLRTGTTDIHNDSGVG